MRMGNRMSGGCYDTLPQKAHDASCARSAVAVVAVVVVASCFLSCTMLETTRTPPRLVVQFPCVFCLLSFNIFYDILEHVSCAPNIQIGMGYL